MEGLTTGCDVMREESVALIYGLLLTIADNEADIDDLNGHPGLSVS